MSLIQTLDKYTQLSTLLTELELSMQYNVSYPKIGHSLNISKNQTFWLLAMLKFPNMFWIYNTLAVFFLLVRLGDQKTTFVVW